MLRLPAPAYIALVLSASDAVSKGSEHAFCVTFYIRFAMRLAKKKRAGGCMDEKNAVILPRKITHLQACTPGGECSAKQIGADRF